MKVYKYLLSVIVLLGLISCSSEESDFIETVVPTADQLTVAFNLTNEVANTKSIIASDEEKQINTCALFVCTSADDEAVIIKKGFFGGNSCTFNFKPENNQTKYYVYAVANVNESKLSEIIEGATVLALKQATASIPSTGGVASNLPKMGGREFEISLSDMSKVQDMGDIPVNQLVSGLQLKVLTNFGGAQDAAFVITSMQWSSFSTSGRIGGNNGASTDASLAFTDVSANGSVNSPLDFKAIGSELYTFPNISASAKLHIEGYVSQNGKQVGNTISHDIAIANQEVILEQNTKYDVQLTVVGSLSHPTNPTLTYEVIPMNKVNIDVPSFE